MGAINAYQFDRGVARVSLSRVSCGQRSHDCFASLIHSIHAIEEDSRVSAAYFALCGGETPPEGTDETASPVDGNEESDGTAGLPRLFKEIRDFPLPLVSTIEGRVSLKDAAAFLASDVVLMDCEAEITIEETKAELDDIASLLKRRLTPELASTLRAGRRLSARDALAARLCDFVAPASELSSMAVSLAGRLGSGPGEMLTLIQAEARLARS